MCFISVISWTLQLKKTYLFKPEPSMANILKILAVSNVSSEQNGRSDHIYSIFNLAVKNGRITPKGGQWDESGGYLLRIPLKRVCCAVGQWRTLLEWSCKKVSLWHKTWILLYLPNRFISPCYSHICISIGIMCIFWNMIVSTKSGPINRTGSINPKSRIS